MKTKTISRRKALNLIHRTQGKIFRVTFTKRSTGEERILVGRLGVSKGITGKGLAFDPGDKGLVTVFDMQKDAYRMISVEGMKELQCESHTYKIK